MLTTVLRALVNQICAMFSDAAPSSIVQELEYFQVTKYCSVLALTVLIYDIIITMDQEVSTVWGSRWTAGKCLYLLTRYLSPVVFMIDMFQLMSWDIPVSTCRRLQLSSTITGVVVITMIEGILIIRTYALYPSRFLLTSLIILALVSLGTMLGCYLLIYQKEIFIPNIFGTSGCLQFCQGPLCHALLVTFWLPFFLLETIVFTLTAWRTFSDYIDINESLQSRFHNGTASTRAVADTIAIIQLDKTFARKPTGLIEVITRDGFVYYLVILVMSAANMLVWLFAPFSLAYMGIALLKSIQVIICSRLLLNIRDFARQPDDHEVSLPALVFASAPGSSVGSVLVSTPLSGSGSPVTGYDRDDNNRGSFSGVAGMSGTAV